MSDLPNKMSRPEQCATHLGQDIRLNFNFPQNILQNQKQISNKNLKEIRNTDSKNFDLCLIRKDLVYSVVYFIVERNLTMLNVTQRGQEITLNFKLPLNISLSVHTTLQCLVVGKNEFSSIYILSGLFETTWAKRLHDLSPGSR